MGSPERTVNFKCSFVCVWAVFFMCVAENHSISTMLYDTIHRCASTVHMYAGKDCQLLTGFVIFFFFKILSLYFDEMDQM